MWTTYDKKMILFERIWYAPNLISAFQTIPQSTRNLVIGLVASGNTVDALRILKTIDLEKWGLEKNRLAVLEGYGTKSIRLLRDRHKRKWISGRVLHQRLSHCHLYFEQKAKLKDILCATSRTPRLKTKGRLKKWEIKAENDLIRLVAAHPEILWKESPDKGYYGWGEVSLYRFFAWWKCWWLVENGKV